MTDAELIAALRAALDDREALARATAAQCGPAWAADGGSVYHEHPTREVVDYTEAADHIAAHDPAFVLADIAAKRLLVDDYERYVAERRRAMGGWDTAEVWPVLTALAEAYGISVGGSEA